MSNAGGNLGKTILAIDDEGSMLSFYKITLTEFGSVRTAANLQEARKQLDGVDLIILDFYLEHDKDLFQEVVPELKKAAPVLLCSGVQELGVSTLGAELGIAGYWNKSSDYGKLLTMVRSVLDAGKMASIGSPRRG